MSVTSILHHGPWSVQWRGSWQHALRPRERHHASWFRKGCHYVHNPGTSISAKLSLPTPLASPTTPCRARSCSAAPSSRCSLLCCTRYVVDQNSIFDELLFPWPSLLRASAAMEPLTSAFARYPFTPSHATMILWLAPRGGWVVSTVCGHDRHQSGRDQYRNAGVL